MEELLDEVQDHQKDMMTDVTNVSNLEYYVKKCPEQGKEVRTLPSNEAYKQYRKIQSFIQSKKTLTVFRHYLIRKLTIS